MDACEVGRVLLHLGDCLFTSHRTGGRDDLPGWHASYPSAQSPEGVQLCAGIIVAEISRIISPDSGDFIHEIDSKNKEQIQQSRKIAL